MKQKFTMFSTSDEHAPDLFDWVTLEYGVRLTALVQTLHNFIDGFDSGLVRIALKDEVTITSVEWIDNYAKPFQPFFYLNVTAELWWLEVYNDYSGTLQSLVSVKIE